jgi:hypothetical protein
MSSINSLRHRCNTNAFPPRMKIPVSIFLRYDDARAALVSGELSATVEVYNPDSARTVRINNNDVPIEYEITSALADRLEESPVWDFEIAGFRSGDFSLTQNIGDGLFMIGAHRFGHIPVVQEFSKDSRSRCFRQFSQPHYLFDNSFLLRNGNI